MMTTYFDEGHALVLHPADLKIQEVGRKILELTQFSPISHPRLLVGKRTAQNNTPSKTSPVTARGTAISDTGGHRLA